MKRRAFIQSALATAFAARWMENSSLTSAAEAPGRRIKIGFLGASHSHATEKIKLTLASAEYELVGICENDETVRRRYLSLGVHFVSQDKLLAEAEAIAVESDVRDHARHARLALEAGKHVHLEKPPADSYAKFQELVKLAREKKRLLQMGYMWRFNPGINGAIAAARQGWLGQVYLVRGTINTSIEANRRPEWGEFRGGSLFELGSHLIDPVVRLLGRPDKVTPLLKNHGGFNDTLADNTVAVLEYPRALAIISSSTLQPGAGPHRFFEIQGNNGTALVKPIEPPKLQIDLAKAAGPYKTGSQSVSMPEYKRYVPEFAELAQAIRTNQPLSVTPEEDLLVQETLMRACDMPR